MLILALDTTTRSGSIALADDTGTIAVTTGDSERTHAERLPGDLVAILSAHSRQMANVDVFVVAAGPGSFTGLRIGIATVQGLAFALGKPVVAVSVLDALLAVGGGAIAADGGPDNALVAAWMDAQRHEVFACLRRIEGTQLDGPVAEEPAALLDRWLPMVGTAPVWFVGDASERYRRVVVEKLGEKARFVDPLPPLAPTLAALGRQEAAAGRGGAPHAVRPVYVRRPDAELARERKPR
ncbi:MAG: tRNA (adenosine(37)-N6)-threonylcarbamoyltransferase complex dimerization subunit type 1 TsaB [Bacteroidales bacterium]